MLINFKADVMKKIMILAGLVINSIKTIACEVCEKQQPKILQGFTHGGDPESNWDYLIVSVMTAIVCATLYFSIKWLVRPGEKSIGHIKHLILNHE